MPPARPTVTSGTVLGRFLSLGSGEIAARTVAFLATTYLTRALGPDGFGIIGLASALCGYAALAVRAGFDDVGARDVARRPDHAAEIAAGATIVRLGLATAAIAVVGGIALLLPKPPVVRLVVILTGLSFFSLALDASWVYKGLGRTARVGAALVTGQLLYVGIVLITVRGPNDVIKVPLAQVAGELGAAALVLVPLLRRGLRPDLREGVAILRASGFVTLTRVLRTLIYTFDVVLIGLWLGEYQVGLYAAAYRFCFLLLAVAVALHVAYLPAFARAESPEEQRRLAARSLELSAAVGLPLVVGGSVLAGRLLDTTFGSGYAVGAAPFRLLLVSIGFVFLYGTVHNVVLVVGRLRAETRVIAVAAAANAVLNVLLIPRYGLVGAAATTALSEALVLVLGFLVVARAGVPVAIQRLLPALAAATVMALAVAAIGPGIWLPLSIAGGAVIYVSTLLLLRGVPADVIATFARQRLGS